MYDEEEVKVDWYCSASTPAFIDACPSPLQAVQARSAQEDSQRQVSLTQVTTTLACASCLCHLEQLSQHMYGHNCKRMDCALHSTTSRPSGTCKHRLAQPQAALSTAEHEHNAAVEAAQLRGRANPLHEQVWTYSVGGDHGQRGPFTLLQLLAQLRGLLPLLSVCLA